MMLDGRPTMALRVDAANPGQFFACCGVLELADRFCSGAEGWFESDQFVVQPCSRVSTDVSLPVLIRAAADATLLAMDPLDEKASALRLGAPFDLRLDWWTDRHSGGDALKVWAGPMSNLRIANAMRAALGSADYKYEHLFDVRSVVYDPNHPAKKVEPFYFDARRGRNARPLDVGFAPDRLGLTSIAYPAVEFLCFIGLQRVRPAPTSHRRVFRYSTWSVPLSPATAVCAASRVWDGGGGRSYQFEVGFRTDQQKYKAFFPAAEVARS